MKRTVLLLDSGTHHYHLLPFSIASPHDPNISPSHTADPSPSHGPHQLSIPNLEPRTSNFTSDSHPHHPSRTTTTNTGNNGLQTPHLPPAPPRANPRSLPAHNNLPPLPRRPPHIHNHSRPKRNIQPSPPRLPPGTARSQAYIACSRGPPGDEGRLFEGRHYEAEET